MAESEDRTQGNFLLGQLRPYAKGRFGEHNCGYWASASCRCSVLESNAYGEGVRRCRAELMRARLFEEELRKCFSLPSSRSSLDFR
jgi:hypothetical protein